MRGSASAQLVWLGWAACLALGVGGTVFYALSSSVEADVDAGLREVDLVLAISFVAYATVGALIASRRPDNRVGWLLLFVALTAEIQAISAGYAAYALVAEPGVLPGGEIAAWLAGWIWVPSIGFTTTILLLLFPSGRLPSRRALAIVALAALGGTLLMLTNALTPGPVDGLRAVDVENPFGVEGSEAVTSLGWILLPLAVLCSAVSLVMRYRRSRGEERLQLKWFVTAAAFVAAAMVGGFFVGESSPALSSALFAVALPTIPIAVGMAIFKHRLYEIDLIIRRTLVYGVLSAGLAGTYFGIVLALQQVFNPLTEGNELAIAGSTLAVAALFRPARRRIQSVVDRRFYRRKYDAQKTLEAFSARLREEIDLEALSAELTAVVRETMQPAHVSLWLRPQEGER